MKNDSLNVERYFMQDAADIEIDDKFKNDLKMRIMAQEKEKVVQNPMMRLKVAGWIAFATIAGGTLFGAGGIYNYMVAKNNVTPSAVGTNIDSSKKVASTEGQTKDIENADSDSTKNSSTIKKNTTVKSSETSAAAAENSPQKVNTPSKSTSVKQTAAASSSSDASKTPENEQPKDNVNTINLTMVAGRYLIKNISVLKTENVQTVQTGSSTFTPDEFAALNLDYTKENITISDGNIYTINHVNNKQLFVDKGTSPALYAPIDLISYIKEDKVNNSGEENTTSSIWIFDGNSGNKYMVLSSDETKYKYTNTIWSEDGKEIYISALNTVTNKYEIIKMALNIE